MANMVSTGSLKWLRAFVAVSALAGLAACQSTAQNEADAAPDAQVAAADGNVDPSRIPRQITQSELEAFCPTVRLRQDSAVHQAYAKGGQGDPTKLTYQASIGDVTRACTSADGMMTITVAVAGRVVPGPAGAPGSVLLPIRIEARRGDEVLYSQMIKDTVTMNPADGASQFMVKDSNVVIPVPDRRNVAIYATFDESAAAAPKKGRRQ